MPFTEYQPVAIFYATVAGADSATSYQNRLKIALSPCRGRGVDDSGLSGKELAMVAREGEFMNDEKENITQRER